MAEIKHPLTHARLLQMLRYDPKSGEFAWINDRSGKGSGRKRVVAGSMHSAGYVSIRLDRSLYLAHRLAWFYVTGAWPEWQIDHIDGVRTNNAWSNLREVDNQVNQENQRKAQSSNKTGLLGVSANRDRWSASIKADGQRNYLGTYDTPELAHAAYLDAKRKLHRGCRI